MFRIARRRQAAAHIPPICESICDRRRERRPLFTACTTRVVSPAPLRSFAILRFSSASGGELGVVDDSADRGRTGSAGALPPVPLHLGLILRSNARRRRQSPGRQLSHARTRQTFNMFILKLSEIGWAEPDNFHKINC